MLGPGGKWESSGDKDGWGLHTCRGENLIIVEGNGALEAERLDMVRI